MRLDGRRSSSNVDDRRGRRTGLVAGAGGIGGLIITALIIWISGGNPLSVLNNAGSITGNQVAQNYVPTEQEERYAEFAKVILAGTEDVWTEEFRKIGRTYEPPKMVLFTGSVNSGCGNATSAVGPFYCSADKTLYIDLSFFEQMEKQMGAGGDFAFAYVIAHEVGHHVQMMFRIFWELLTRRMRRWRGCRRRNPTNSASARNCRQIIMPECGHIMTTGFSTVSNPVILKKD